MTQFCVAEIPLWDDLSFYVDGNSKITRENGSYKEPKPNAFSLPHISSCPGSTKECRASCYVHGLAAGSPEVYKLYALNAAALHNVLSMEFDMQHAAAILGEWVAANAPAGFRWHVSGDVMNANHAHWIAMVCRHAGQVPFWIYTRTTWAVGILQTADNLTINVSADAANYAEARLVAVNRGVRLTYLTRDGSLPADLPPDSVIFPDYSLRGRSLPVATDAPWWQGLTHDQRRSVCPADFFGQSEAHRCGPCAKCLVPLVRADAKTDPAPASEPSAADWGVHG